MGRSSQAKAQENRARIVETACRMFRQSGVENVSVAQVMAANGMTVGGFYKHFASKDALVAEAFEQSGQAWEQVCQRADGKAEARGPALVRQYLRNRAAANRCPLLVFSMPVATGTVDPAGALAYASGTRQLFDRFIGQMAANPVELKGENKAMVLFAAMLGTRLMAQAVGDEPWIAVLEAAVNQAAGVVDGEP